MSPSKKTILNQKSQLHRWEITKKTTLTNPKKKWCHLCRLPGTVGMLTTSPPRITETSGCDNFARASKALPAAFSWRDVHSHLWETNMVCYMYISIHLHVYVCMYCMYVYVYIYYMYNYMIIYIYMCVFAFFPCTAHRRSCQVWPATALCIESPL